MTVLVMLLVKALHCLLLQGGTLGAVFIVMRSEDGLGELGALWRGSPGSLVMGTRQGFKISYGMLTVAVEANCCKQY